MGFLDIFSFKREAPVEERKISIGDLSFKGFSSFASNKAMKLAGVYCAVNQISNAVASIPMNVMEVKDGKKRKVTHRLNNVLNITPNQRFGHFQMWKQLVESVLLKGNGYALIVRDSNLNVTALEYLDADNVTPTMGKDGRVKYLVNGLKEAVDNVNMIHLYMHLDENFMGISTIRYALESLDGIWAAEKNASSFFKGGSNVSGVIEASAPVNNDQKMQIKESWQTFAREGVHVAILPQGLSYKPIAIDPSDASLLETREYGNNEIARWFNIPPAKLWVMEKESYNSLEFSQLAFLSDTVQPMVNVFESEFNRKLFKPSEVGKYVVDFDYTALLETDKKSQATYYNSMISNGVLSINEVREKLGFEPVADSEGGNAHFIQISYGNMKNVADGSYIKQTAQDQNQKLDNKITDKNK